MSEEQLKAFLEAVKADAGLQEKLKAAADADTFVAIAKAAGFVISAEELLTSGRELSDEELEGIAGGCGGIGYLLFSTGGASNEYRDIRGDGVMRCAYSN
jgi:predicted ribosomally synthesized peptide with nif11-like leader